VYCSGHSLVLRNHFRRKQYSNKLKEWGFIKNISGSTANWMVNKAKVRKREGKETEFTVGDQPWTMDRIERSAKRTKIEGNEAAILGMLLRLELSLL
jgi:hypothetical protein